MSPTVATPWFGIAQSVQWLGYELDELIRGSSSRRGKMLFSSPKCPGRISGPPSPYSMATEIPSWASARGVILIILLQPVARLSLTWAVLPHRTWFHGTRRIYFTSSKLINITKVTLHGGKLYRDNRFSHFNKQVWIKPDQQITKSAVREVNHASFHLSSTFLCKITQEIKMSADKKKYWRIQSLRRQFFKLSVWNPL